jgi:hypothetical protein
MKARRSRESRGSVISDDENLGARRISMGDPPDGVVSASHSDANL